MTTHTNKLIVSLPSDREIMMTREFNAPRELVFEVWTKAEHLVKWCAPECIEIVECRMDARPGGEYLLWTRGTNGMEFPMKGVFVEVIPPSKFVHTLIYDVDPWRESVAIVTVTLEEREGKTHMTNTYLHPTMEARNAHYSSGMELGAMETFNQLDVLLAELWQPQLVEAPIETAL